MDWRHHALCRDLTRDGLIEHDLFFPVSEVGAGARQVARAKAVCDDCPVRAACLSWALTALPDGVAGGSTAAERARMRHDHAAADTAPQSGCDTGSGSVRDAVAVAGGRRG